MQARKDRIQEYRLKQPMAELDRKARKALTRARLWTQEGIDLAHRRGRELAEWFASKPV